MSDAGGGSQAPSSSHLPALSGQPGVDGPRRPELEFLARIRRQVPECFSCTISAKPSPVIWRVAVMNPVSHRGDRGSFVPRASGVLEPTPHPKAPDTFSLFLTHRECKNKQESAEPHDTRPRTHHHPASTMNDSRPTWLPLNHPLPLFFFFGHKSQTDLTSFHPWMFFSKDLKRENKHHHDSIILLEKCIPPPRSGPRSRACVGEAVAYLCSQRHAQGAADVHILRGRPTLVGCPGLQWGAGLCRGAWGDKPGHFMQLFCCFTITLSASGPFPGHCWASPL